MSEIYKELEKIKTHDIKIDDSVIMTTGHYKLLIHKHGVVIETEHPYPEINQDKNNSCKGFYNNYIVVSIGALSRPFSKDPDGVFVERVRPEGFVSSSTAHEEAIFKDACKIFVEKNKDVIFSKKLRRLDIGDGVTFGGSAGSLFLLEEPATLVKLQQEVVKRLAIDEKMLKELNNNEELTKELFDSIDEQMNKLGCKYYTFERHDGGEIFRLLEGKRSVELRAYGLRRNK